MIAEVEVTLTPSVEVVPPVREISADGTLPMQEILIKVEAVDNATLPVQAAQWTTDGW